MRTLWLTVFALVAFAANSILCRLALREGLVDPATFSSVRLTSGAAMLWMLSLASPEAATRRPRSWASAVWLAAYALPFAFAYVSLDAGTGALILFASVQVTMLATALWSGERPQAAQWVGLAFALGGLVYLVRPGLAAPPLGAAALMATAGMSWGVYSVRGRGAVFPIVETTRNFMAAAPLALGVSLATWQTAHVEWGGVGLAALSGAGASAVGYAIWYAALPALGATRAAIAQLSVPVLAAGGGILLLGESLSPRLALAALAILGGVALAVVVPARQRRA